MVCPNIAKAGGRQSQGEKGEAVVNYRKPLTTQDLEFSGFPEGEQDDSKTDFYGIHIW